MPVLSLYEKMIYNYIIIYYIISKKNYSVIFSSQI